jgi:hypothetical protein
MYIKLLLSQYLLVLQAKHTKSEGLTPYDISTIMPHVRGQAEFRIWKFRPKLCALGKLVKRR